MAGKKSKTSGKLSNGGRTKAKKHQEEVRQAKFAAKREAGKAYEYKPNPYEKGSVEWQTEQLKRAEKAKSSKLPYARMKSIFAKLDNKLAKEREELQKKKSKAKKGAAVTA